MRNKTSAMFLIQLFIGIYFAATAVIILSGYNSTGNQFMRGVNSLFGKNNYAGLAIAIVQLLSGIILILGLFVSMKQKSMFLAGLIILVLWGINIVMLYFLNSFMKPNFLVWIKDLSLQLVILSALWGITRQTD
ncbi:MAG TPA: hypothetical protein DCY00_03570 [Actinobacteria bacterium]|nr:hypothetical protein [Actinomycetota bacterium]